MPLLISSAKHKHRRFLITYEQGRIIIFALAHFIGASAFSQDEQIKALRKEAAALYEVLRAYRWEQSWPPP